LSKAAPLTDEEIQLFNNILKSFQSWP